MKPGMYYFYIPKDQEMLRARLDKLRDTDMLSQTMVLLFKKYYPDLRVMARARLLSEFKFFDEGDDLALPDGTPALPPELDLIPGSEPLTSWGALVEQFVEQERQEKADRFNLNWGPLERLGPVDKMAVLTELKVRAAKYVPKPKKAAPPSLAPKREDMMKRLDQLLATPVHGSSPEVEYTEAYRVYLEKRYYDRAPEGWLLQFGPRVDQARAISVIQAIHSLSKRLQDMEPIDPLA